MATTMFFEQTVHDKERRDLKLEVELGRSSFYGENLIYLKIDDKFVVLDKETGRAFYEAVSAVGSYLGYDK